eukprot:TRINITY_DN14372_c0_g2_i3.p1 TRINITY_DN14372_c0_g2~~TRINITY_DN14372_c0_g2_i3.p1  ORF type:complete len:997 (+),score=200.55 TRINITY_DN14372_c0_g2_i3:258-3248(+)
MHRSGTPIIFLVIIIFIAVFGFVFWANLTFGRTLEAFEDIPTAFSTCIQMFFGQSGFFHELRQEYPLSGGTFFIVYMLVFGFGLQNFAAAVVICSYGDAREAVSYERDQEESRKRARESEGQGGFFKRQLWRFKHQFHEHLNAGRSSAFSGETGSRHAAGSRYSTRKRGSPVSLCAFTFFLAAATGMAFLMTQNKTAHAFRSTVSEAVRQPLFSKTLPISDELHIQNSFDSISSRSDVMLYLQQALPQTLFNTSEGGFAGRPNPLLLYDSALKQGKRYRQLVIKNWNIVLGQSPVRITTRYFKMRPAGDDALQGVLDAGAKVRDQDTPVDFDDSGLPSKGFKEADTLEQIIDPMTREALHRHCSYTAAYHAMSKLDANGFACMLDTDYSNTATTLHDMYHLNLVSSQAASVVIDFVLYNAYAETFAYVAITFGFQPNGRVKKDIIVRTVRLDLFHGPLSIFRVVLEIVVLCFSLVYFISSIGVICKAVIHREDKDAYVGWLGRIFSIVQAMCSYLLRSPFVLLNLVSSALTIATLFVWYTFCLSDLPQQYFFQEIPEWSLEKCRTLGWTFCSDEDTLRNFGLIVWVLETFNRVVAFNSMLIFFRMLRYLQRFQNVRIIFNTFYRGMFDIFCFILVIFVLVMGYLQMGRVAFGSNIGGLRSWSAGLAYCFNMFLGHFNYDELLAVAPVTAMFFFFSFMLTFRLLLVNIFLAIIDKNFQDEDAEYRKCEKEFAPPAAANTLGLLARFVGRGQRVFKSRTFSGSDGVAGAEIAPDAAQGNIEDAHNSNLMHITGITEKAVSLWEDEDEDSVRSLEQEQESEHIIPSEDISDDSVGKHNQALRHWHQHLPVEMKRWALTTSGRINAFVSELVQERGQLQKRSLQGKELEKCMEDAESRIREQRNQSRQEAERLHQELCSQELKSLAEIHKDQESLSWYIMKREAEMKKLEDVRSIKQDSIDKMVFAAKRMLEEREPAPEKQDATHKQFEGFSQEGDAVKK